MTAKTVINANPPSTAPTMMLTFRDDDDARFAWLLGVGEGRKWFEEAGLAEVGVEKFDFEDVEDALALFVPEPLELEVAVPERQQG